MQEERWRRIEDLFERALELPQEERAAFLDEQCAGDGALRVELAELLASATAAVGSLRAPIAGAVRSLAGIAITAQLGRRIGAFRVTSLLGEGGMGVVYLAERDDAEFAQRVAIKILAHAVGSPQAIRRFRDERQILAALDHPNIVRLLDGGSTAEDQPYLVMEHIEGQSLTRYAEDNGLSVRARVELVRQVCAALQYAHQNLVIHCDIKPSNILVGSDGVPKVLDFGIAKLLAPIEQIAHRTRTHTRTGLAAFTPEYASPEQARGIAVSTATDVYSTGAVLYQLMTGQPPHRSTGSPFEILRDICEVEPPRPSAIAPAARRRELAGDLDNIILKALQKEPARRYASMEQLSDDLVRWMEERPVAARTATLAYRARKFTARNKALVAATVTVTAALFTATAISLRQAQRADEQTVRAEAERGRALESAERARVEAERARNAELRIQAQLDELRAEQSARARAEAEARAKSTEAELALQRARREQQVAEQQSGKARAAEQRAQSAAHAERQTREQAEVLYEKERARVKQLEEANKKITTRLP